MSCKYNKQLQLYNHRYDSEVAKHPSYFLEKGRAKNEFGSTMYLTGLRHNAGSIELQTVIDSYFEKLMNNSAVSGRIPSQNILRYWNAQWQLHKLLFFFSHKNLKQTWTSESHIFDQELQIFSKVWIKLKSLNSRYRRKPCSVKCDSDARPWGATMAEKGKWGAFTGFKFRNVNHSKLGTGKPPRIIGHCLLAYIYDQRRIEKGCQFELYVTQAVVKISGFSGNLLMRDASLHGT